MVGGWGDDGPSKKDLALWKKQDKCKHRWGPWEEATCWFGNRLLASEHKYCRLCNLHKERGHHHAFTLPC